MAAALQEKEIVGLMADRLFGGDSNMISPDFLGNTIRLPVTPFRLAAMQGTPIAVVLSHRENRSKYRVEVFGVIRVPPGLNRKPDAYEAYGREYTQYLTHFTEKHPFEFYNFYDMWDSDQIKTDKAV